MGRRGYVQRSHSETWYDIILPPKLESAALLKSAFESADGSTSVRAMVCSGSFGERFSRACRAASFEELKAASRGGDGYLLSEGVDSSSSSSPSSSIRSSENAAADEEKRIRGGNAACCCCRRQHGLVLAGIDRAVSNCPLHLSSRNLFICDI